jgi:hypothetical protein
VLSRHRTIRLAALAAFLVLVAVALWLADLSAGGVVAAMVIAWTVAACVEWLSWRDEQAGAASQPRHVGMRRAARRPAPAGRIEELAARAAALEGAGNALPRLAVTNDEEPAPEFPPEPVIEVREPVSSRDG